eukprot:345692-Pyramimonas_sp.AAC.1
MSPWATKSSRLTSSALHADSVGNLVKGRAAKDKLATRASNARRRLTPLALSTRKKQLENAAWRS